MFQHEFCFICSLDLLSCFCGEPVAAHLQVFFLGCWVAERRRRYPRRFPQSSERHNVFTYI